MNAIKMSAEDLAKLLLSTGQHTTSETDAVRLLGELKAKWLREADAGVIRETADQQCPCGEYLDDENISDFCSEACADTAAKSSEDETFAIYIAGEQIEGTDVGMTYVYITTPLGKVRMTVEEAEQLGRGLIAAAKFDRDQQAAEGGDAR